MSEKYLLTAIVVIVVIIIFFTLVLIVNNNNKVIIKTQKILKDVQINTTVSIKDMSEIAAKRASTNEDLKKAINLVAKELPFPKKIKYKLPKGIKVYLNFVLLVASHKNADAKLIAYMDKELKKANNEYSTEIDIYENEGLRERSNRI